MTFDDILDILADTKRTEYQKAADLHAALVKADPEAGFSFTPRRARGPNKPKPVVTEAPAMNGQDHAQ